MVYQKKTPPLSTDLSVPEVYAYIQQTNVRIDELEKKIKRMLTKHDKLTLNAKRTHLEIVKLFENIERRMGSWEESLLYVMHNIKKNQFLYSNYPDDWVQNYQDLKNGLKSENEWMDKKIENSFPFLANPIC